LLLRLLTVPGLLLRPASRRLRLGRLLVDAVSAAMSRRQDACRQLDGAFTHLLRLRLAARNSAKPYLPSACALRSAFSVHGLLLTLSRQRRPAGRAGVVVNPVERRNSVRGESDVEACILSVHIPCRLERGWIRPRQHGHGLARLRRRLRLS